jgi:hypothetical protein
MVNKIIANYVFRRVMISLSKKFTPLEKYVNEENELDVKVKDLESKMNSLELELTEIKKRR